MYFKSCEVCGVKSGRNKEEKRLFMAKFPLDEERCKQWVKVVGKEDLAYLPIEKLHMLRYVCGKHFKPSDFARKKTRLKKHAVPSLFMVREPLKEDVLQEFPMYIAFENIIKLKVDCTPKIFKEHNYSILYKSENKRQHCEDQSFTLDSLFEENEPTICEPTLTSPKRKYYKNNNYKTENMSLNKELKIVHNIESPISKSNSDQNRTPQGNKWTSNNTVTLAKCKKSPKLLSAQANESKKTASKSDTPDTIGSNTPVTATSINETGLQELTKPPEIHSQDVGEVTSNMASAYVRLVKELQEGTGSSPSPRPQEVDGASDKGWSAYNLDLFTQLGSDRSSVDGTMAEATSLATAAVQEAKAALESTAAGELKEEVRELVVGRLHLLLEIIHKLTEPRGQLAAQTELTTK